MKETTHWLQKTPVVQTGALICCALWGSAFPCIKIGYELFHIEAADTPAQILFAGFRFTLAGILTILTGSLINRKLLIPKSAKTAGKIIRLSLLQTVIQYLFFYVGLAHTTGVKASVITGMNVFVAILVASLIFHQESLSSLKIAGCLTGFAGVILINLTGSGLDSNMRFQGEGFIFLSAVAYALSSVFLKRYSETEHPVLLSGWQFFAGGIIMILCGLAMGGRPGHFTPSGTGMLLYLALVSALAYSLWGILLKYNPVSRVTVFGFMNPVFGVLLSALLLGETGQASGVRSLLALVLVCTGICLVNTSSRQEPSDG